MELDDISSIIGSLSNDDIDALKGVAQALFSDTETKEKEKEKEKASDSLFSGGIDIETIGKIASVMGMLGKGSDDPRCSLLYALKPLLKQERRHKVDEAAKMLQMLELLPKFKEQFLG